MTFLIASNIALWIGFIALLVINLALARQIGVLYERVAPAGALALNARLRVGDAAPELALETLTGERIDLGRADAGGRSTLVFFLSPDCPVCSSLVPALKSARKAESDWLRVMVASDGGDRAAHLAYSAKHGLDDVPYVVSEILGKQYGVSKLPYAVLIDQHGRIASLGIVNSREHLESLFEAKEHGVASIQEYLQRKNVAEQTEVRKA